MKKGLLFLSFSLWSFNVNAACSDFTTAMVFSNSAYHLKYAVGLIADQNDNIWIANQGGKTGYLTELKLNPNGTYDPVVFSGLKYGFDNPVIVKVDGQGNIWAANIGDASTGGTVTELSQNPDGRYYSTVFSNSRYGFNGPFGLAVDGQNNIWIANVGRKHQTGSVTELKQNEDGSYSPLIFSGSRYQLNSPTYLAADQADNIWVANYYSKSVTELKKNSEGTYSSVLFSGRSYGFNKPVALTIDNSGNVWTVNTNEIIEIKNNPDGSKSPIVFSAKRYGFNHPNGINSDSDGNIWVANSGNGSVSVPGNVIEIKKDDNGSYRPVLFAGPTYKFNQPIDITVDSKNNVWVLNAGNDSVTEIISPS